jgi:uncharacterized protein YciI
MEYLCFHRDRQGSAALRDELLEQHWAYMDGYAGQMIARGPTLTSDRADATGSVHILDLPDARAAADFALNEPYYRAGVFRDVLLRRWTNVLGRTMWDFPGGRDVGNRYFVLGLGAEPALDLDISGDDDEYIAYGPLLNDDGRWLGTAALLRAADAQAARRAISADDYGHVEVHDWQFGGRV